MIFLYKKKSVGFIYGENQAFIRDWIEWMEISWKYVLLFL